MAGLTLVMPMGGRGSRFFSQGIAEPKPLISISGRPFFYWAVESVLKEAHIDQLIAVVLQEHIDSHHIDREILRYYPQTEFTVLPSVLNGPVLTCKESLERVAHDNRIIFNDCDHMFRSTELHSFLCREENPVCDGALLTFQSENPAYSYVRYGANGEAAGTVEKIAVSNTAICGMYYFRDKQTFESAYSAYAESCPYDELFMSGMYDTLIRQGSLVQILSTDFHLSFGTPEEYALASASKLFDKD